MHSSDCDGTFRKPLWFILGAWLLLGLGGPGSVAAQQSSILVYGDSLSASYGIPLESGWVSLLQKRLDILNKPYQVINASVTGETTDGGLRRLSETLQRTRPELVILELGGNDGLRGFPLKVIEQNLTRMVADIRDAGAEVLLVGMRIPPNYGTRYADGFHQLYQHIAQTSDVPLVPFMLEDVAVHPDLMQDDRIHPRAQAQAQILDTVWTHLKPLL